MDRVTANEVRKMENITNDKQNNSCNIVFEGKLTTQSMQRLDKHQALTVTKIIALILTVTFVCGIVLLYIDSIEGYWAFISFSVGLIASTILAIIVMFTPHYPLRVEIKEDTIHVESADGKVDFTANTNDVKKVYDYPECYVITFRHKYSPALCQKDIVTCGTLQNFENLFGDTTVKPKK